MLVIVNQIAILLQSLSHFDTETNVIVHGKLLRASLAINVTEHRSLQCEAIQDLKVSVENNSCAPGLRCFDGESARVKTEHI